MNTASQRITLLARQRQPVFHTGDLARLWNIQNPNTLYTVLKRYTAKGLLFRIYKGLYSLLPPDKLDPLFLGLKALHSYAYVSTETILIEAGLMMQMTYQYTLISRFSRHFTIGSHAFRSRKLEDKYLFNAAGIIQLNGILKATPERALADLFYFNPRAYVDGIDTVDFKKLNQLQKEIGYQITPKFHAHPA